MFQARSHDNVKWQFALGDANSDGIPDIFGITLNGTGSAHTEVHVLGGSKGYRAWILHAATALGQVSSSTWRLTTG